MKNLILTLIVFFSFTTLARENRPIKVFPGISVNTIETKPFGDSISTIGKISLVIDSSSSFRLQDFYLIISSEAFCAKYKVADFDTIQGILSDTKFDIRIEDRSGKELAIARSLDNEMGKEKVMKVKFYYSTPVTRPDYPVNVKKPVIYCYYDDSIHVNMVVESKAELAFVYPEMNLTNGWEFDLVRNSIELEGQKYPYLFWEGGLTNKIENVTSGFMIKTDTVVSFLENSLSRVGFNATESADFITFWAPILSKKEEVFITFLQNKEYANQIADLKISPSPETLIRLFMVYDFDYDGDFITQKLVDYDRKGFTVLDWGGGELEINNTKKKI